MPCSCLTMIYRWPPHLVLKSGGGSHRNGTEGSDSEMTDKAIMTHRDLVEAMIRPSFYPHGAETVELIQTHISFIFIAGDIVYKVKKAVDFGFLDFTSLQKRQYYCREELRLNRRLAPEMYLDVVEICEDGQGHLHLGGEGRPIEYALKMKRLPQERMLKKLLAAGTVERSVMDSVASRLADFHRRAATGGQIDRIGGIETIRLNHEENFDQTERYIGLTLPAYQFEFIRAYARGFLERRRALFEQRVADHKIRDCHGDLHLEHICITDGIIIFDCIEFNERFRYEDVAAEVAFLAMDLDYNGYSDYAEAFVEAYVRRASDPQVAILLNFYKCYYAYVRGKVTSFRLDDRAIALMDQEAAAGTAVRYFDLAYTYAAHLESSALILMAGLMGTGKSPAQGTLRNRTQGQAARCLQSGPLFRRGDPEDLCIGPGEGPATVEGGPISHRRCLLRQAGGKGAVPGGGVTTGRRFLYR
jgi:aminoglycoside phosphotransferase family enzyme